MDSSRFGSSGNLSQTSSQLSEAGQGSSGGSEPEETFHSYHSTGFPPSSRLPVNGHAPLGEEELRQLAPDVGQGLKKEPAEERSSSRLQRYHLSGAELPGHEPLLNLCLSGSTRTGRRCRSPRPDSDG